MTAKVYTPSQVDISIGGFPVDGWNSISISRNSENTGKNVSADGKVSLTKSADRTGSFEIEVPQQNSGFNTYAVTLQALQDENDSLLMLDIVIADKSGGVLCYLNAAHLDVPASQDLTAEAGGRSWVFYVQDLRYVASPDGFMDTEAVEFAKASALAVTLNPYNLF